MFGLDESKPDYFTDTEETERRPEAGTTLDFGGDDPDRGSGGTTDSRNHTFRNIIIWIVVIAAAVLIAIGYFRYFSPYATDAHIAGYVASVERRGIIFKTYEAEIISEASLTDTTHIYSRTLTVSIPDRQLARRLQAMQGTGRKVNLVTERYYGMLPWRGASTTVVTAAE